MSTLPYSPESTSEACVVLLARAWLGCPRIDCKVAMVLPVLLCGVMRIFDLGLFQTTVSVSTSEADLLDETRLNHDHKGQKIDLLADNRYAPKVLIMREDATAHYQLKCYYAKYKESERDPTEYVQTISLKTAFSLNVLTVIFSLLLTPVLSSILARTFSRLCYPQIRSVHGEHSASSLFLIALASTIASTVVLILSLPTNLNHYLPAWSRVSFKPNYTVPMAALHQAIAGDLEDWGDPINGRTLNQLLANQNLLTPTQVQTVMRDAAPLRYHGEVMQSNKPNSKQPSQQAQLGRHLRQDLTSLLTRNFQFCFTEKLDGRIVFEEVNRDDGE